MNLRSLLASSMRWVLGFAAVLSFAGSALAQDDRIPARLPLAAMSGFFTIFLIMMLAMYVYMALAIQTIATKTNTENPWLAWIPIINLVLLLNIAKKPIWWFI